MRLTHRLAVGALAAGLALSGSSPAQAEEPFTVILASVAPADSPWSALLTKYKKEVEAKSGGRIKIKPKLGGMLGDENETVTKTVRGQIQAVGASTGAVGTQVPELNVVELPYLFDSAEEADQVIDEVLTPELEKVFRKRGLVLAFWSENGFRHFGTREKPVKSAADLKGQKMRAQESPVHLAMYKALGAAATPIPTTEVPQALATGNVDGFDQSLLYAIATAWHKSVKHVSLTGHIYQPGVIVYNAAWFDKLPADLQKLLIDEGRALQQKGRKAVRDINPDLVKILESEKVTVYNPTAAEKKALAEVAKKSYAGLKTSQGKDFARLLDLAEKKLAALRKK
jgi:tripartite ATP-independent transporter DctP family solute receptor